MDFNQLKLFLQVAQTGSFDKVAERNFVSQRAVSRDIKRLENSLGIVLFSRTSNRIYLTSAGKYFAQQVETYLNSFDNLVNNTKNIAKKNISNLHVGYFSVFDGTLLRDQIINYKKQKNLPKLMFTTVEESVEHLLADIALGNLDCGYINHYGNYNFINSKLYNFIDVYSGEMMLAVNKEDSLSKKDVITESDLIGKNLFYYSGEESQYMRDTFLATLGKKVDDFNVKRVPSIEQLMINCSLGYGYAYVTMGLFEKFLAIDPNLTFKRIKSKKINQKYTMQLVYRKDNYSNNIKTFTKFIKSMKK